MPDKKRLFFLYNERAGRGQVRLKLPDIIRIFTEAGYEVTAHPTLHAKDAIEAAASLSPVYQVLAVSGGDGTVEEVITGLMRRGAPQIPIGYIPAGSTNDFASSLAISPKMLTAARDMMAGTPFPCDVGRFCRDYFIYVAAFGVFTDVSYETPRELKNTVGHLAYILEGSKRLSKIKSYKMKITWENHVLDGEFIYGMVTNSRSVGGFRNLVNARDIFFDDGIFEVTLIEKPRYFFELQNIAGALLIESAKSKYIHSFKTNKIVFESKKDVAWAIDGEYGGTHKTAWVENKRQAVSFLLTEAQQQAASARQHPGKAV